MEIEDLQRPSLGITKRYLIKRPMGFGTAGRRKMLFHRGRSARSGVISAFRRAQPVSRFGGWSSPQSAEIKSVTTGGSLVADTTGGIQLLNGIARGDDFTNRIGRSVSMNGLNVRIHNAVTGGNGVDQVHRVLVVLDRQPNGVALAATDVLESATVHAQYNRNNRLRFQVLYDRNFVLNASGEAGSQSYRIIFIRRQIANYVQTFNAGNAGTIADISTNSIYLISLGNSAPGATAGSTTFSTRFYFKDK